MIVLTSLLEHVGRLVHADARAAKAVYTRHRDFLALHLGLFVATLAAVPVALACGHVPAIWEALAAVWLIVPVGASAYLSATGRLQRAEAACLAAWGGFGLTTTLCGGTSLGGGCALLLLLPLQGALGGNLRLIRPSLLGTAGGLAVLFLAASIGLPRAETMPVVPVDVATICAGLVYASVLALASAARQGELGRQLASGSLRCEALAAATGELLLSYDRTAGVLTASREADHLFGTNPRSLLGRGFFERVHVADRPTFLKMFSDAAQSGDNVCARLRFRTGDEASDGRAEPPVFAWIEIRARRLVGAHLDERTPADADDGQPQVLALVRDITAQMDHETALERAKEEAERANAWKDSFLANVSHELRTPLNAIIGFSEMLSSQEFSPRDPAKQREYSSIITASGQHLLSVVNSLLDISKIEAGCFDLVPETFSLGSLIASCCDMVSLKAEQAGIAIHRRLDPGIDEIVGDRRACKQIVINLLSNALKFTPQGGQVTIEARPQGNSALITVADTGIGISPRDLGRLGDAFFQGQAGYDRHYEGTGLGLSVVRGLVGLHGGGITVESALGEGTRVVVQLPVDCRTASSPTTSARIEVISRYARSTAPVPATDMPRVQKIA